MIYGALFVSMDYLAFEPRWDEPSFWRATALFSSNWLPTADALRSYGELNTPLPFILYGLVEKLTGMGIRGGRILNFATSLSIALVVASVIRARGMESVPALAGLLLFPYFLYYGALLYTDHIAAFLVLLGVRAHLARHHAWTVVWFVLAIASRQYMVAFPLALVGYELIAMLRSGRLRFKWSWFAPLAAALSLLGWIAFFGGLSPPSFEASQNAPAPELASTYSASLFPRFRPENIIFLLAVVGLYFVIPEAILYRRSPVRLRSRRMAAITVLSLVAVSVLYAPYPDHGLIKKLAHQMPDLVVYAALAGLAVLTGLRFPRFNLGLCMLLAHCAVMTGAWAWDKYALPLLVVLWYLRARGLIDQEPAEADASAEGKPISLPGQGSVQRRVAQPA